MNLALELVKVNGGLAESSKLESGCANGAAGTLYVVDSDLLVIDNQNNTVTAATNVKIPLSRQHNSQKNVSEVAKFLVVRG